ncbi:MAG TPA: hypothetical protein G4N92_00535 [Anaerolineae bacterium]|nr:hypothetical protein [Anaerolineae bacterium]
MGWGTIFIMMKIIKRIPVAVALAYVAAVIYRGVTMTFDTIWQDANFVEHLLITSAILYVFIEIAYHLGKILFNIQLKEKNLKRFLPIFLCCIIGFVAITLFIFAAIGFKTTIDTRIFPTPTPTNTPTSTPTPTITPTATSTLTPTPEYYPAAQFVKESFDKINNATDPQDVTDIIKGIFGPNLPRDANWWWDTRVRYVIYGCEENIIDIRLEYFKREDIFLNAKDPRKEYYRYTLDLEDKEWIIAWSVIREGTSCTQVFPELQKYKNEKF